jgi:molybdopterin molybdotransferase
VDPLSFEQARACVISKLTARRATPAIEEIDLLDADGRVLARLIVADRDYPAASRSARDGFALRAEDLPSPLRIIGEVRAGERSEQSVGPGEAIEIMTGAPVPPGANAVVMIEHTRVDGGTLHTDRRPAHGEAISQKGSEARAGETLLEPGRRLGFAEIALLATVGCTRVPVYRRPRVAILATGDELIEIDQTPLDFQVRNSNACSLAVQVKRAGGCPHILPVAQDNFESTLALVERGLEFDLLLLSGGVSAGKYDVVERVLASLGTEFFFDRALIQPGQPVVFGQARGRFFFGLPGNPASTMVTFEVFARVALELLSGQDEPMLPLLWSRLTADFHQKAGLTRFLPARLSADAAGLTPISWKGSSDVPAVARANAFLVTEPEREQWQAGDWMRALLK